MTQEQYCVISKGFSSFVETWFSNFFLIEFQIYWALTAKNLVALNTKAAVRFESDNKKNAKQLGNIKIYLSLLE